MPAALVCLVAACPARAEVSPLTVIDGPSADIIDFGGVAMAPERSVGAVYRRRVNGRTHIFAAQTVDGAWRPPQQIDVGQAFGSSWPAIGAGNGGRLVVVWVQEFGTGSDRMFS